MDLPDQLLIIGPTTFLPTYGQSVLGLGAVAAGSVLAAMSIGWPLATSQSARLFLRAGFRDTQLTGAVICLAAVAAFLLGPQPPPVWQPVVETFVLGAGLGLLSVASIVGAQSMVSWGQRGVVTGTVMFCRYLGQSLGAAIFGASSTRPCAGSCTARPPRCATGSQTRSAGSPRRWPGPRTWAGRLRITCAPRSPSPPPMSMPRSRWWPR